MKFTLSAAPNQSAASTRIFVSITNTSSKEISFGVGSLCRLTDLIVTDAHGTVVPQDQKIGCLQNDAVRSPGLYYLKPGESYNGSFDDAQHGVELATWGYPNLPAGTYTVRAIPSSSRLAATINATNEDLSALSNVITLTLR